MIKILVPIDLSEHSVKVFQIASGLAKKLDSSLTLYYAAHYLEPEKKRKIRNHKSPVDISIYQDQLNRFINKFKPKGNSEIKLETRVDIDFPVEGILRTCNEISADLIVMGMRNKRNWEDFLFGSVARLVNEHTKVPTMMIPPEYDLVPMENAVCLVDSEINNPRVFQMAEFINKLELSSFHCIYVALQNTGKMEVKKIQKQLGLAGVKNFDNSTYMISITDAFVSKLSAYIEQKDVSLIMMGKHDKIVGKALHSKTDTGVVRHMRLPILFLPN